VEIVEKIGFDFHEVARKLHKHDCVAIAIRVRRFDEYVRDFLARFPNGVVVSIGCGLDDRFSRIDNGQVIFYDLDFPGVIAVRRRFLTESARNRFIASSALDFAWMSPLETLKPRPFLFIAVGVFPYFSEDEAKTLLEQLRYRFPGTEIAFDVVNASMVKKMSQHSALKETEANLRWGIRDSRDVETLCPGAKFLDDWYYSDKWEPKLGFFNLILRLPRFKKTFWAVRYRL
jgi:O-methyltransferase involved in polyketide biosynthesis